MGKIKKLKNNIINNIAAGEIIESPSSVVKELIENSIDAESKKINIIIQDYGLKNIIVKPLLLENYCKHMINHRNILIFHLI